MRAAEIDSNFLMIFSKNFSIYPADRQSSCVNNASTRTQAMLWIRLIFNNAGLSYHRETRCVPWWSLLSALASERGLARINALSTYRIRDAKPKLFARLLFEHDIPSSRENILCLRFASRIFLFFVYHDLAVHAPAEWFRTRTYRDGTIVYLKL